MTTNGICEGRVCVVTGGGRGLGREYALLLAKNGASVVVNDLGSERDGTGADAGPAAEVADEIRAAGGSAVSNGDDIGSWEGASSLINQAIEEYGRLDVLINNAGILRDRMVFSMTEEEWDAVIRVHLKGTFATTHHAAAHWRQRSKDGETNDARIINTTSVSGIYANPSQGNYAAAKAGIAAFTQVVAQELTRYGVTANAIAPGAITRLTGGLEAAEAIRDQFSPDWVAPVVAWLASPDSADINGQVIESSGLVLGVAEGWRRGPTTDPVQSPQEAGAAVRELVAKAQPRTFFNEVS